MPDLLKGADILQFFLTGAVSDGAAQTDPDASLGNYRSSTRARSRGGLIQPGSITNIRVDRISGGNSTGNGVLTVTSASALAWTPPGGTQGNSVAIASGQDKIIEGLARGSYVQVHRLNSNDMYGNTLIKVTDLYDHLWGFDDVTDTKRTSGDDFYRGAMLRNSSTTDPAEYIKIWIGTLATQATTDSARLGGSGSGTITTTDSFADWSSAGYAHVRTSGGTTQEIVYYTSRTSTSLTVPSAGRGLLGTSATAGGATDTVDEVPGIRIALENVASNNIQTIADELTAPTGRSWSTAITEATGLAITSLARETNYGLWVHRQIPANIAPAGVGVKVKVEYSYYSVAA